MKRILSLLLSAILLLTGCTINESSDTLSAEPSTSISAPSTDTENSNDISSDEITSATFPAQEIELPDIEGKITNMFYKDDSTVYALADKLYLYNVSTGSTIAQAEIDSFNSATVQAFNGGCVIIGTLDGASSGGNGLVADFEEDGSIMCIFFDDNLNETTRVNVTMLISDNGLITSEKCVAASSDGTMLCFASLDDGLYTYDIANAKITQIIDFTEENISNNLSLSMVLLVSFVRGDSKIAFLGLSNAVPLMDGRNAVATYGTVALDGTEFTNYIKDGYNVDTDDMAVFYDDLMFLPEPFVDSSGRLLLRTISSDNEVIYSFSTSIEGQNGVFCSDDAAYFATAVLDNTLTVRIYETASGELVKTETITHSDTSYFGRMPKILILDDSRTCVVLLGTTRNDLDTVNVTFGF